MNDPSRLRIASNQAACRLLLESALEDHSAPGAAERALYALNLSVGAAATAVAVHAGASSSVGSVGSHLASGVVLKWLGLGLLAGAATLVSAEQAVRVISDSRATPTAAQRHDEGSQLRQPSRAAVTTAMPGIAESAPPPLSAPAQHHAEAPGRRASNPLPLAEQAGESGADPLRELQTVRRALAGHEPGRALALLDGFVARHPSSPLLEESAVLRFDAWLALDSSRARTEGEAFLRRYPRSAYAERVRVRLLGIP